MSSQQPEKSLKEIVIERILKDKKFPIWVSINEGQTEVGILAYSRDRVALGLDAAPIANQASDIAKLDNLALTDLAELYESGRELTADQALDYHQRFCRF